MSDNEAEGCPTRWFCGHHPDTDCYPHWVMNDEPRKPGWVYNEVVPKERLDSAIVEIEQTTPVFQSIRAWAEHGIRRTTPGITQDQFHYIKHACDQALQTKRSCGCDEIKTHCSNRAPADWACGCECHESDGERP